MSLIDAATHCFSVLNQAQHMLHGVQGPRAQSIKFSHSENVHLRRQRTVQN